MEAGKLSSMIIHGLKMSLETPPVAIKGTVSSPYTILLPVSATSLHIYTELIAKLCSTA